MSVVETSKILIADDHPLFREALRQVVGEVFGTPDCVEASDLDQALSLAGADDSFDLILLDLNMPGMNGFTGLVSLRNVAPSVPIVMVSATEERMVMQEAITFGASGFIPKFLAKEEMAEAVRQVVSGGIYLPQTGNDAGDNRLSLTDQQLGERLAQLTGQQRRVLEMLVMGKSNKTIAYELSIAESTVKAHVSAILRKLNVHSRTQAVINAGKIVVKLREASA